MISVALALLLAQTTPTSDEIQGAKNALAQTISDFRAGTRTYTFDAGRTLICVKFAGGGSAPPGAVTLRMGAAILTPALLADLGVPDAPKDDYVGLDVQAAPASAATYDLLAVQAFWDTLDSETTKIASPLDATCEVLIARSGAANITNWLPCACRTGNPCSYDPDGAGPLPSQSGSSINGFTFGAGTWSGGGCRPKSCVTRFDGNGIDNSWPSECPK